jgi:hypothetical protein
MSGFFTVCKSLPKDDRNRHGEYLASVPASKGPDGAAGKRRFNEAGCSPGTIRDRSMPTGVRRAVPERLYLVYFLIAGSLGVIYAGNS